jgi:opine dehydrogenase
MNPMKVAVMGGGNGSHTIAADLALKGLSVNMFEMEQFAAAMQKVFECREIELTGVAGHGKARLNLVTSDIVEAIEAKSSLSRCPALLPPHMPGSSLPI